MSTDPLSACNVIAPATENAPTRPRSARLSKLQAYWVLTKSRQTLLLLAAGLAGYLSARPAEPSARTIVWMALSLFLAVSGTTALNMVADRDIDARMTRTTNRPLPAGLISPLQATIFALALTLIGLAAAFALDGLFGLLISAGVFFDLVIYTFWLKRRSPSSIIFGGISGAMPILAGRALCTGAVDGLGIVLALSILLWIPSHIMPLWIRYAADYAEAGIPTWPQAYGLPATRWFIAISNLWTAGCLIASGSWLSIGLIGIALLALFSAVMVALSFTAIFKPSARLNYAIFKFASIYMLTSLIFLTVGAVL